MEDAAYLFVYGTLRPGSRHPMAKFLAEHAQHIGRGRMAGRLYDLGRYPGMVATCNQDELVIGDVFLMDDANWVLVKLDEYEGATGDTPRLFDRKRRVAQLDDGSAIPAWVYEYQGIARGEDWLPSGNYLVARDAAGH